MFGGKKKSSGSGQKRKGDDMLAQMGLNLGGMDLQDDDDDEDLEAELARLQGLDAPPQRKTKSREHKPVDLGMLSLAADSLKDIDDDDEDVDLENDPELLADLQSLTQDDDIPSPSVPSPAKRSPAPSPHQSTGVGSGGGLVSVLEYRITMYNTALDNAQSSGDSSKARRYKRALQTLKDLLKQAKAGKPVPEDEIPPVVNIKQKTASSSTSDASTPSPGDVAVAPPPISPRPPPPTVKPTVESTTTPSQPSKSENAVLYERKNQYKLAALHAKRAGDEDQARQFFRTAKQFEAVIAAVEDGKPVDLSKMPPPPPSIGATGGAPPATKMEKERVQGGGDSPESDQPVEEMTEEEHKRIFNAPTAPTSTLDALQQRLEKYQSTADNAKKEGSSSKARRMGRIAKDYEDAIKMFKAGKPVDFDGLPTPPGFAPIPKPGQSLAPPKSAPAPAPTQSLPSPSRQAPAASSPGPQSSPRPSPRPSPKPSPSQRKPANKREEQLAFIMDRQKKYKLAAYRAKQDGDITQAKEYLKMSKGFDQMIEALESGLPVDMSQLPPLPGEEEDSFSSFEFVQKGEVDDDAMSGNRDEMYKKLEQDLITQIRNCSHNSQHFTQLGDIHNANKFDKLGGDCRRDLDSLKNAYKHGDPVPRFHYEDRTYSMIQSCTDLGDNDLEINIIRGLQYSCPSGYSVDDMDTYVKYEFPYPTDNPQNDCSNTVKNTNCPEYNQSFKLEINRKSRSFLRLLKNKSVKFEIYYKRGFLKSDKVLATASLKIQPLEEKCIIHESLDLMDGRRAAGGRIEVKLRIRDPFVHKQVDNVSEKWLVIENFGRSIKKTAAPVAPIGSNQRQTTSFSCQSIEVLKYEKQMLEQKIETYKSRITQAQLDSLNKKSGQLGKLVEQMQDNIRKGGMNGYKAYATAIEPLIKSYHQEVVSLVKTGDKEKGLIAIRKKKIVEKEVQAIRSRIP